jgi:hypothetical protein
MAELDQEKTITVPQRVVGSVHIMRHESVRRTGYILKKEQVERASKERLREYDEEQMPPNHVEEQSCNENNAQTNKQT